MTWNPTDKQTLWTILNLDREQLIQGSTLSYLMTYAEQFDVSYSTEIVASIQSLMEDILAIQEDNPPALDGSDRLKSYEIQGEYKIEYQDGATQVRVAQQIESKKTQILGLLDPYRDLAKFTNSQRSRVIT